MVRVEPYGALIPLSGYKYVHKFCPREVKWILFQDDDTIITEQNFQKISASSQTTCLANKYSGSKVMRADSPEISRGKNFHWKVFKIKFLFRGNIIR